MATLTTLDTILGDAVRLEYAAGELFRVKVDLG